MRRREKGKEKERERVRKEREDYVSDTRRRKDGRTDGQIDR